MGVIRVEKTSNYTVMSNYHFREKNMSLKAKGLLSLMLSLPEEWDYSVNGLVAICKEGKDGIISALKELEKFGYLKREQTINSDGKFAGMDYVIYEKPNENLIKANTEKPFAENPHTVKPNTENPQQLNTNILNTNINKINTDKDKKDIDISNLEIKKELKDFLPETQVLLKSKFIKLEEAEKFEEVIQEAKRENNSHDIRRICKYIVDHSIAPEHIINKLAYFESAMLQNIRKLDKLTQLEDSKPYIPERPTFYNWLEN